MIITDVTSLAILWNLEVVLELHEDISRVDQLFSYQ